MSKLRHELATLVSSGASSLAVAVLAALGSPYAAAAQPIPQAIEFHVNQYTTLNQSSPAVAADSQGNFVVVWGRYDAVPMPDDIAGLRFDSSGNVLGAEFLVNTVTSNRQRSPWVARAAAGSFVVVWASIQDGDVYGVFGQRFDAAGNAVAAEFQINGFTTAIQTFPRLAMGPAGDFVVVWQSYNQDGDDNGVFARRFDSAATAVGGEFQVNLYTTTDQQVPSVSRAGDGSFIVAWHSEGLDGSPGGGAFARRYTSGGAAVGGEFQLNTYTTDIQTVPVVAYSPGGGFVAAWASQQDGSAFGIFSRAFDAGGNPTSGEFQVNSQTAGSQTTPAILSFGGTFLVTWSGYEDGDSYGVFGRVLSSTGQPRGDEFQINTTFTGQQRSPRIAAAGNRFVVAWHGPGDGANNGIFARRYLMAQTLDVDGDGEVKALTDSMLIMRYTFGFRGDVLVDGAVGDDCTRCNAESIEAYIDQM